MFFRRKVQNKEQTLDNGPNLKATGVDEEGSTYKVPLTHILAISPHNNADSLELATVYGFQVIVKKGVYTVGDQIVYIPIDSILPQYLEDRLFPMTKNADGVMVPPKVKLNNHRVRQIRLRGLASQGMLVNLKDLPELQGKVSLEEDLKFILGVTKYEPPVQGPSSTRAGDKQRNRKNEHPQFHKYNGLDNIKWFPQLFEAGEQVVIQEKLHGTNARASLLPYRTDTLWRKLVKFFGFAPAMEQCYGSNNVQKSVGMSSKVHFYSEDVWGNTFKAMDVFSKIKANETVFGEIIGPGIQKNYDYGLKEHKFVLFDVKVLDPETGKQTWLDPDQVEAYAQERGFEYITVLFKGEFNKDLAYSMTFGNSVYCPKQKVREGIVIKARQNYSVDGNKKALKWVSEDYLADTTNTDNH